MLPYPTIMAIAENHDSWETLQKGQIAELAFERIALANGYAVKYTGRQYTELLEPSTYRRSRPPEAGWLPDFELKKRIGGEWTDHAIVEVKWRSKRQQVPSVVPPRAQYLVLFTPEGIFAASVSAGQVGSLGPLSSCPGLDVSDAECADIVEATQALLAAFSEK